MKDVSKDKLRGTETTAFRHKNVKKFHVGRFKFLNNICIVADDDMEEFLKTCKGLSGIDQAAIVRLRAIQNEVPFDAPKVVRGTDAAAANDKQKLMKADAKLAAAEKVNAEADAKLAAMEAEVRSLKESMTNMKTPQTPPPSPIKNPVGGAAVNAGKSGDAATPTK